MQYAVLSLHFVSRHDRGRERFVCLFSGRMLRPMSMEFVVLAEVVDTHSIHEARLDVVSTVVVAAVVDAVLRLLLLAEIAVAVAAAASQIRIGSDASDLGGGVNFEKINKT